MYVTAVGRSGRKMGRKVGGTLNVGGNSFKQRGENATAKYVRSHQIHRVVAPSSSRKTFAIKNELFLHHINEGLQNFMFSLYRTMRKIM